MCRADGVRPIGRMAAKPETKDASEVIEALSGVAPLAAGFEPSVEQREELGLITRRLFMARRAEEFLSVDEASYADRLIEAAVRRPASEPEGNA